jgi:hypothetical protein
MEHAVLSRKTPSIDEGQSAAQDALAAAFLCIDFFKIFA